MALFLTFVLGAFFAAGAAIVKFSSRKEIYEHFSLAAAFGALIGLAAFDLIPDIAGENEGAGYIISLIFIAAGFVILKILDGFVPDHDSADKEDHMLHIGVMSVIAISIHNIVEGMTLWGVADASLATGISMTIGIGLHNIPMGMLIYASVRHERRAGKYPILAIAALSTFAGGLAMFIIKGVIPASAVNDLVCIALGMVVYLLIFELIPVLRERRNMKLTLIGAAAGLALVLLSAFIG